MINDPILFSFGTFFLLMLLFGVSFFLYEWRNSMRQDRELKLEEIELRRSELESNARSTTVNVENTTPSVGRQSDLNGYVFIAVPEGKKSLFSEMLKGFEEYARLKGYKVSLSIDASINGNIGFKFTLHGEGVSVSTERVKSDINDYINNVMSGGDFDGMPILITPEEHSAVIGTLKARLRYMEYTHALEKENKEFYQSLISKMSDNSVMHSPANINLIQKGVEMDSRSYSANNSANIVQGDDSKNLIKHSNIQIGSNVSEINSQLKSLQEVIDYIGHEAASNQELKPAVRYLENTKEELEESESPDTSSIAKWLEKANSVINTAKASAEIISKFGGLLKIFGVSL